MPSLSYFLDRSKQSCESIQSLKFQSPGIFTNSFMKEPSITRLLKDAAEHEQALYKINKPTAANSATKSVIPGKVKANKDAVRYHLEMKPERIDGKSYYVDYSFNDYTNLNINNGQPVAAQSKRTAVRIPEIVKDSNEKPYETNEAPSSPEKIFNVNLIPESIISSNNINEICETILSLIRQYPNLIQQNRHDAEDTLLSDIVVYHQQYNDLANEIDELEEVVSEQKEQLTFYNINLSERSPLERSPTKRSRDTTSDASEPEPDVDIDELIRQEEQEIRELEEQLTKRQRSSP